jgi:hypothetical protein
VVTKWIDVRAAAPWLEGGQLHVIGEEKAAPTRIALENAGFTVTTVDCRRLETELSVLAATRQALGLPTTGSASWDAFIDSLGESVYLDRAPTVLIFDGLNQMASQDHRAYLHLVHNLASAAEGAGSIQDKRPNRQMEIVIVTKSNFAPSDSSQ